MNYTPEQVLHIAKEGSWPECSAACFAFAEHLRAHADALAELAALRAQLAERDAEIARLNGHAEAMAYITEEYWNGNENERAMADALNTLDNVVSYYRADFPEVK